jgi:predicted nuclease of predicted toxin-antitoxin system
MTRTRLYITLDSEWVSQLDCPESQFKDAIVASLEAYGEKLDSFEYDDGIIIIDVFCEDRDADVVQDIMLEGLLTSFPKLYDSQVDIEIVDVFVDDDYHDYYYDDNN